VSHDTLESQMDSDPQDYFSAYVRSQGRHRIIRIVACARY
jgi:hypothetical protein